MKKNFEVYFLLIILLFFFPTSTFSQTIIKEKVSINPAINLPKITAENDSCTITVQISWSAGDYEGFIGIIKNAGWFAASDWVGGGANSISVTVSSLEGLSFQLRLNLDEKVESDYSYAVILNGVTIQHGIGKLVGRFLYFAYTNIELNPSVFSGFRLDLIDSRTGSNTNQLLLGHTVSTTLMPYVRCNPTPSFTRTSLVNLSFSPQIENVAFFDYYSGNNLGISFSAPLGEFDQYKISLEPNYYSSEEKEIYITAKSGNYSITDTLIIPPVTYSIHSYPEVVELVNDYEIVNVNTYSEGDKAPLPDFIRYNIEITKGDSLISLIKISSGEQSKSFYNIEHVRGKFDFEIIREFEPIWRDDTAIVKISTTNPNITPKELKVIYHFPKIDVKFSPLTIAPGDTADVILKKKNDDGTLVDFPQDQLFDVQITAGANYGTIFLPEWGDKTDEAWGVAQGFKFIANENISDTTTVQSTILVKTSAGIAASVVQGSSEKSKTLIKNSAKQLMKTNSILQGDEQLWGTGTITIGEELTLKINLTGPKEIWPYKAVSAGYNNPITNVKIKVTNGDKPLTNEKVKITIKRIDRSGGHDHPNSPDLTLWGRISVNGVKGNPVTAYTDQNGEITTEEIRASEFGGEYFIEAYLDSKSGIKDKADFIVKVPGLELLPISSYYDKIGGTDKHNGPPRTGEDHNHLGAS